jgi:hypothetical protein
MQNVHDISCSRVSPGEDDDEDGEVGGGADADADASW